MVICDQGYKTLTGGENVEENQTRSDRATDTLDSVGWGGADSARSIGESGQAGPEVGAKGEFKE